MLTRNIVYYEARIGFGLASLLPLLLLPGYTILGWIVWSSRAATPSLYEAVRAFELLLTLAGGLAAAHLMTIEREEGFDEIRRTYPEWAWRVPMMRAFTALGFLILSGLIAAGVFYLAYGQYDLSEVLLPAFAPTFYLCGLALLVNNVSGSYWVSAGMVIGYWFGEVISGGAYTRALFLFNHSTPLLGVEPQLNRGLLLAGTLLFFVLNTAFSIGRRRGSIGR